MHERLPQRGSENVSLWRWCKGWSNLPVMSHSHRITGDLREAHSWFPTRRGSIRARQFDMKIGGRIMNPTKQLHDLGQSLWLDNISRELLVKGTLQRYIHDYSITGLTSNPTIFDQAIRNGSFYDDSIRQKTANGKSGEQLFYELAFEDLTQAADLFRPVYDST